MTKKVACGVFVDFQKAFDTVNHDILFNKLAHLVIKGSIQGFQFVEQSVAKVILTMAKHYTDGVIQKQIGFPITLANFRSSHNLCLTIFTFRRPILKALSIYEWFKSYLDGRKQFVSILGFQSNLTILEHGVPQGSVLGPLLFLIYINDLNKAIKHSTVYHFADNTNLLQISNSYKEVAIKLNKDLKYLYEWLFANKISLNTTKTEIIFFRKPRSFLPSLSLKVKLDGKRIYPTNLGIHLDETLNGSTHCQQLLPKLRRAN